MNDYDMSEPPVIVFPNPTTAIDENGVRHTVKHKRDYTLPKGSGMAWHPAMGRYVPEGNLFDEFEILAADYYARYGKPW
jgi:hypothetical protein